MGRAGSSWDLINYCNNGNWSLGLGRFVPFLLALPVMAAASYYLVVLNGPTPVVKERSENTLALLAQRTLSLVLTMIEES